MPGDKFLAHLLDKYPEIIYKYQEHESLLEEVEENILSEEEKENLWLEYKLQAIEKAQTRQSSRSTHDFGSFFGNILHEDSSAESDEPDDLDELDSDLSMSPNARPLRPLSKSNKTILSTIGRRAARRRPKNGESVQYEISKFSSFS